MGETLWATSPDLDPSIPVFGFTAGYSEAQLYDLCSLSGLAATSKDCQFIFYQYNATIAFDQQVVARNPLSKLFVCYNCTTDYNSFLVDQNSNIPWFATTLMEAVGHIRI